MVPGTGRANLPPWVLVMMATSGSSIRTQKEVGVENAKQDLERGSQENKSNLPLQIENTAVPRHGNLSLNRGAWEGGW